VKPELARGTAFRLLWLVVVGCEGRGLRGSLEDGGPSLPTASDGGATTPACPPPSEFGAVPSDVAASAMIDADETSFYFATWWPDATGVTRESLFSLPLAGGRAERLPLDVSVDGGFRVHQGFLTHHARYGDGHFRVFHLASRSLARDFDPGEGLRPATWDADFESVAWLTASDLPGDRAALSRRRWSDGLVETLASGVPGSTFSALTLDGGQIFWLASRSPDELETDLWTWDPVSRRAFKLAQAHPPNGEPNGRLAVDERAVYFERPAGDGLSTVPRWGGQERPLAEAAGSNVLSSPIVDDRFVYWKEGSGDWRAVAKSGAGGPFSIGTLGNCNTAVRGGATFSCAPSGFLSLVQPTAFADDAKIWQVDAWWRDCRRQ
jgi:hypothetical protein